LNDVNGTITPNVGDILIWDGMTWQPQNPNQGGEDTLVYSGVPTGTSFPDGIHVAGYVEDPSGAYTVSAAAGYNSLGGFPTRLSTRNAHVTYLFSTDFTGCNIRTTGVTYPEGGGVPSLASVNFTIDSSDLLWQSKAKFLVVTDVETDCQALGAGGATIDIGAASYIDLGNRDFSIRGHKFEFVPGTSNVNVGLRIYSIKDLSATGQDEMVPTTITELENIGVDGSAAIDDINDFVRTGAADRSFSFRDLIINEHTPFSFKATDFLTLYGTDAIARGANYNEGFVVQLKSGSSATSEIIASNTLESFNVHIYYVGT
jgi:hypothetical protein